MNYGTVRSYVDTLTRPVADAKPESVMDLLIRNGWGDTPPSQLPDDCRVRIKADGDV